MRFLGSIIVAIGMLASPSAAWSATVTVNSVGLSIDVPGDWMVPPPEMVDRIMGDEKARLRGADTSEFNEPTLGIIKYPEPYSGINPTLCIQVGPLPSFGGYSPMQVMPTTMIRARTGRPNMSTVERPTPVVVSGFPAARAVQRFYGKDGHEEGRLVQWLLFKDQKYVYIYASYRADESNGSRAEIEKIIDSMKLSK